MRKSAFALAFVAALALLATTASALPPPLPSSHWGVITLDGRPVPSGSKLSAYVDGVLCGETTRFFSFEGTTGYSITVKGDNPDTPEKDGGRHGDVIRFRLNHKIVPATAVWIEGGNSRLNLAVYIRFLHVIINRYEPTSASGH
jgi:hypothetical protein